MSYHQAILRKDGPTHAVGFISRGHYESTAACGITVGPLATIKARKFPPNDAPACKRCVVSV